MVRFAYLVGQTVVPAFLSFIYIFSGRPLYPEFARSHRAVGLRPLTDQQIAGFVSKLSMLLVLLAVGAVVLARASTSDDEFADDQLVWADVERQFERVDRRGRRGGPDPLARSVFPSRSLPHAPTRAPGPSSGPSDGGAPGSEPPGGERPPEDP